MLIAKRWFISLLNKCGFYVSRNPITTQDKFVKKIVDQMLLNSTGILHIGAHLGQESEYYYQSGAKVLWVEANPLVYEKLLLNINRFPNQKAICVLLGDKNDVDIDFNLASNNQASSSIFKFGNELGFEKLIMESTISLRMHRLENILTVESILEYNHWVIDVQGAELLVLRGAGNLLKNCKSMVVEVSTRQVYDGGSSWHDLENFLRSFNFVPLWKPKADSHEDIVFLRT